MKLHPSSLKFTHVKNTVTFHPSSYAKRDSYGIHLAYNLDGGMLIGIENIVILKALTRSYSRLTEAYINGVINTVRSRKDRYRIFVTAITLSKADIQGTLSQFQTELSTVNPDFKRLFNIMKLLRKQVMFLRDVIKSMQDQVDISESNLSFKMGMTMRLKFLSRAMKQIWSLAIKPNSMEVQENFSGFQIGFPGMMCFYSFCLRDVHVLIDNNEDNSNRITINCTLKSNQQLGGYLILKKGSVFRASVSKDSGTFDIHVPIITRVFGKEYKTSLFINRTHFIADLGDVVVANVAIFGIQLVAPNSESINWQNVIFTLYGRERKLSKLSQSIEDYANSYVIRTANSVEMRLKRAQLRLNTTRQQFEMDKNITDVKYQRLLAAMRSVKDAKIAYLQASVKYNTTLKRFQAQRQVSDLSNLEKILNDTCMFQLCQKVCVNVPSWKVCQKPISIELDTMKCQQYSKQQKVSVVQTYQTDCQRTIYYTESIYTGNCRAPSKRIEINPIKNAFIYGSAGYKVGSLFGPVGALIGGIIGGIVGFFSGLFGGCDDTWEAVIRYKNIQVPCTQARHTTVTKKWTETECYPQKISAISGYDVPERCNFSVSCHKVDDPSCLQNNSECRTKRQIEVRKQLAIANISSSIFQDLQNAEQNMKEKLIVLQRARTKLQNAQQNYDTSFSRKRRAKVEFDLADANLKNLYKITTMDKCIMDAYLKLSNNVSNILRVTELTFQTNRVNAGNLALNAGSVSNVDSKKTNDYLFSFEFDDSEFSTKKAAEGLVRNLFCKFSSRRRRSIDSSGTRTNTLTESSIIGGIQDLTASQKACIKSTVAFNFLRKSIDRLANILASVYKRNASYQNVLKSNAVLERGMNWTGSNDTVLVEQGKLLADLKNSIALQNPSSDDIWKQWLHDMEVITVSQNFTGCFGFEDCLEQTFVMLENLPSFLNSSRRTFLTTLNKTRYAFMHILSEERSNYSVPQAIQSTTLSLNELINSTLFCEGVPTVRLTPSFQVKVLAGSSLTLRCLATSKLKLNYRWIKGNKTLPGNENSTLIINNIQKSNEGRYFCEAWTISGKSVSEECYVVIGQPPRILQGPQNFVYRTSMSSEMTPSFICKISADPNANISWFFHSYISPLHSVDLSENSSVLNVYSPIKTNGGYYVCFGKNEIGNVTSNKARLDVLSTLMADQGATLAFLAFNNTFEMLNNKSYLISVASNRGFAGEILTNMSYLNDGTNRMNVTIRLVESSSNQDMDKLTDLQIVKRVSQIRKAFAGVFSDIVVNLTRSLNNTDQSNLFKETVIVYPEDGTCPDGMQLHSNGVTCGKMNCSFFV